jgi:hypothetical protein
VEYLVYLAVVGMQVFLFFSKRRGGGGEGGGDGIFGESYGCGDVSCSRRGG